MTNIQKYCIINYTEYKGVLNILLCIVNLIFSSIRNHLLLDQITPKIENCNVSFLKENKGKVIIMIKILNTMFALGIITQGISTFILRGTDSTFLYVQYFKTNNRL